MTPEQRAEALRLADEFGRPFPEPGYSDLASAAALLRELAGQDDAVRAALQKIAALDPATDSEEGFNEWGEADCFSQAQKIAAAASPAHCTINRAVRR